MLTQKKCKILSGWCKLNKRGCDHIGSSTAMAISTENLPLFFVTQTKINYNTVTVKLTMKLILLSIKSQI